MKNIRLTFIVISFSIGCIRAIATGGWYGRVRMLCIQMKYKWNEKLRAVFTTYYIQIDKLASTKKNDFFIKQ